MTRNIAAVIDKISMWIERGRKTDRVGPPRIAHRLHVEVSPPGTNLGGELRSGRVRQKPEMGFERERTSIFEQRLQLDQGAPLQTIE
jgi:hypothetical protein